MLLAVLLLPLVVVKRKYERTNSKHSRWRSYPFSSMPHYMSGLKRIFKDEGLNIDLQTTAGGDKTMTALLSGGIDIALVGSETSIYVHQQGAKDPVINFAQLTQTDGTF